MREGGTINALPRARECFGSEVRRPHEEVGRQLYTTGTDIRDHWSGDASAQGSGPLKRIGAAIEVDIVRERSAHRPRPGERIDGVAVAGSHHRLFANAVRDS